MNKASSSFVLFVLAILFVSFQSYAQVRGQTLQESLHQDLRPRERLRLSELLRLSYQDQEEFEILSLRVTAQALQGREGRGREERLELSERGRVISSQVIQRQLRDVQFVLPQGTTFESLELTSTSPVYLSQITAEVRSRRMPDRFPGPHPGPRPDGGYDTPATPNSFLILRSYQQVRGFAVISVDQLARQQYGVSLEGAEVEMVIVQGDPVMYGRPATVQVELNRRLVGDIRYLNAPQSQIPLPLQRGETVRSLSLVVNGDALITEIRVRVGEVRPRFPEFPSSQRIFVQREVGPQYPLFVSELLRFENRLIRTITIEARSSRQLNSQITLLAGQREIQGVIQAVPNSMRVTIQLRRPVTPQELRIESIGFSVIETLEFQFENQPRY